MILEWLRRLFRQNRQDPKAGQAVMQVYPWSAEMVEDIASILDVTFPHPQASNSRPEEKEKDEHKI